MLTMDLAAALAADRSRDLTRAAQTSRLAALARCCRPNKRTARQLQAALSTARRRLRQRSHGTVCCAGA